MGSSDWIDALGTGVRGWPLGQRVCIGFLAESSGYCEFCRNGDLVNCRNQEFTGVHQDGGYAEVMIAKASGLVSIPDALCGIGTAIAKRMTNRGLPQYPKRVIEESHLPW